MTDPSTVFLFSQVLKGTGKGISIDTAKKTS